MVGIGQNTIKALPKQQKQRRVPVLVRGLAIVLLCSLVVVLNDMKLNPTQQRGEQEKGGDMSSRSLVRDSVYERHSRQQAPGLQNRTTTTATKRSTVIADCPKKLARLRLPKVNLDENEALFLHIGKAGGGTIFEQRIKKIWRVMFPRCHEQPCSRESLRHKAVMVNLRDPVDRFVSAFYWTIEWLCDPSGNDTRIQVDFAAEEKPPPVALLTGTHCKVNSGHPGLRAIYFTYGKDVNRLVENLCSSRDDPKQLHQAQQDLRSIAHAAYDIVDWLKMHLHNTQGHRVFPIVTEPLAPDLVSQTDEGMEWLHNKLGFESAAQFAKRKERVQKFDACSAQHPDRSKEFWGDRSWAHSSKQGGGGNSNNNKTRVLSPENEKCLVQFYKRDYGALAKIKDELCESTSCRVAIQLILDRRAPLLAHDVA